MFSFAKGLVVASTLQHFEPQVKKINCIRSKEQSCINSVGVPYNNMTKIDQRKYDIQITVMNYIRKFQNSTQKEKVCVCGLQYDSSDKGGLRPDMGAMAEVHYESNVGKQLNKH